MGMFFAGMLHLPLTSIHTNEQNTCCSHSILHAAYCDFQHPQDRPSFPLRMPSAPNQYVGPEHEADQVDVDLVRKHLAHIILNTWCISWLKFMTFILFVVPSNLIWSVQMERSGRVPLEKNSFLSIFILRDFALNVQIGSSLRGINWFEAALENISVFVQIKPLYSGRLK